MKVINDPRYFAILKSIRNDLLKNISLNFSGSSPPEIFVGEFNYPNINTGILAPINHDENSNRLSSPEEWFKARLNENEILLNRASMVYSRFTSNVKPNNKLTAVMQEVSMTEKPTDVGFELKKKPTLNFKLDGFHKPIFNPAPLKNARLEENPIVSKRVEYIVSDNDLKANGAVLDLYSHDTSISNINRLLSAGLLGINIQRKLVPTKWAITCVDDIVSRHLSEKAKQYQQINEYLLFYDEYLGNHYEILLMPRHFSFEVIEARYNEDISKINFWRDYESHCKRKEYASSVTGAYYANKLAILEYMEKIKRQASILVLREIKDYNIPCGVGILREVTRNAMSKNPLTFNNINSAMESIKTRLKMPVNLFLNKSLMLKEIKEQTTMAQFFGK